MSGVVKFLKSQNTHLAWWAGVVGISLCAFFILGDKVIWESWCSDHLGRFANPVNAAIEGAAIVALYAWFPALIAAFIGRPPYIPQKGSVFVAKDNP